MATNLALDDELIEEARQLGGLRTKKDVVTQALQEYVQRRRQSKLLELFGTVDFEEGFDAKVQRSMGRTPLADL
ncbi:MAG: type II toxin-antitoxin system VapB family antitoxin [Rhodoferax sp.]|jgi:Arc/MetJ family transcription regulator|nr:type II toxin-antitoxin system VapB family antitoxin [Rhodoferax sp.]